MSQNFVSFPFIGYHWPRAGNVGHCHVTWGKFNLVLQGEEEWNAQMLFLMAATHLTSCLVWPCICGNKIQIGTYLVGVLLLTLKGYTTTLLSGCEFRFSPPLNCLLYSFCIKKKELPCASNSILACKNGQGCVLYYRCQPISTVQGEHLWWASWVHLQSLTNPTSFVWAAACSLMLVLAVSYILYGTVIKMAPADSRTFCMLFLCACYTFHTHET